MLFRYFKIVVALAIACTTPITGLILYYQGFHTLIPFFFVLFIFARIRLCYDSENRVKLMFEKVLLIFGVDK